VRVKHAEHAWDRPLIDCLIYVDGFGVVSLDDIQDTGKVPDRGLVILGGRGSGSNIRPVNTSQDSRYKQDG
jgi:hypothetical protein